MKYKAPFTGHACFNRVVLQVHSEMTKTTFDVRMRTLK